MERLILVLLTPSVILAQRYHGSSPSPSSNPNDEPFLPIHPLYPYSPKLMKRGAERDIVTQLTPELYAPKLDARDSYTASFGDNYQRDPYYPNYNPYPKTSAASAFATSTPLPNAAYTAATSYPTSPSFAPSNAYTSANSAYNSPNTGYSTPNTYSLYGGASYSNPYPYSPVPYGIYNAYSTPYPGAPNPYASNPYASGSYPNYNYQAPYYYPNYYNQPYPVPPPPPPPRHPSDEESSSSAEDTSAENETGAKSSGGKKTDGRRDKHKDDSDDSGESKDEQFVDGANFLSTGSKDLDGQPSTYKTPNSYNQLEQLSDVRLGSPPAPGLPRTTYRVISVGGQPVGPDYPLPTSYAKVQQLEQLMSQALAKLLAQNAAGQAAQTQFRYHNGQQVDPDVGSFGGQVAANKQPRTVIAKTGLAYVANPSNLGKVGDNPGQFFDGFGNRQNSVVIKVQDRPQGSTMLSKAAAKYAEGQYGQKAVTTVSLQQAPGIYIPPEAKNEMANGPVRSSDYSDYDSQTGHNYDEPLAPNGGYKKNEENYSPDPGQGPVPYHSSNLVTVQTPQAQSYRYSGYLPTQSSQQQQQQQQPRDYKTSLDDVNFSTKRNSKA